MYINGMFLLRSMGAGSFLLGSGTRHFILAMVALSTKDVIGFIRRLEIEGNYLLELFFNF